MPWTYQQRMDRACRLLSDRDLIDSSAIEVINRPLFFAKYKFSLGISPTHQWWHRFDELKQQLVAAFVGLDVQVVANPATYDFYVYGNDVAAIRWVAQHDGPFFFNFLRLIPESAWRRPPPSPRFKGKFYGVYQYRVRMKSSNWGNLPDSQQALNAISGDHRVVVRRHVGQQASGKLAKDSFIYANKLNDVLMLKLILGDQIADIEER